MNGKNITIKIDGYVIACSTGANIVLRQEVEEYNPLPHTSQDDGWARFVPGELSWDISNNSFYATGTDLISRIVDAEEYAEATIQLSPTFILEGNVMIKDVSLEASCSNIARMDASFIGDNFPTLCLNEEE